MAWPKWKPFSKQPKEQGGMYYKLNVIVCMTTKQIMKRDSKWKLKANQKKLDQGENGWIPACSIL